MKGINLDEQPYNDTQLGFSGDIGSMTPFIIALALIQASTAPPCAPPPGFLELPVAVFDQSEEGWRRLADQECYADAAQLIETYREAHDHALSAQHRRELLWHEGQMLAYDNRYDEALARFTQTYPDNSDHPDAIYKVDAVIAFLERDMATLLDVREALAALPEPPQFRVAIERLLQRFPDAEPPDWPPGLARIDNYVRCFDYPYAIAYEGLCLTEN